MNIFCIYKLYIVKTIEKSTSRPIVNFEKLKYNFMILIPPENSKNMFKQLKQKIFATTNLLNKQISILIFSDFQDFPPSGSSIFYLKI